ncbi:MAG: hypothetical protein WA814_01890 [Candidatus Baltobacteraceae bacterium]
MRTVSLFLAALALTAQSAAARDAYAEVSAMRVAFAHVRSVVAVERFSSGQIATIEYAAPNRYHITLPKSQIVLAGDVEYAKPAGGAWKRSPNGGEHQALLSAAWQLAGPPNADLRRLFAISPLGAKLVDGAPARGYLLRDTAGAYDEILWVGANELPVAARIEMPDQTLSIHYIDYNSSIMIAMP